ncbi:MAG: DUF4159 domain-containing protein [Pikeienuella sp.]
MLSIGSLAFLNPWLLTALIALPALWLLLRATPPAPARMAFPGVRLLLGLEDPEKTPDRTPWWLLLLRLVIAALVIGAFADPVLNPRTGVRGEGPLVIVMDGGWASAPDWEARRSAAMTALDQADRSDRPVSLITLSSTLPPEFSLKLRPAAEWRGVVEALLPEPWAPQRATYAQAISAMPSPSGAGVLWITDGLAHGDETGSALLAEALAGLGALTVAQPFRTARGVSAPRLEGGRMFVSALRAETTGEETHNIALFGHTPDGGERRLGAVTVAIPEGEQTAAAEIDLPLELRNQIARVALLGPPSAGAAALTDQSVRRRRVGLAAGGGEDEALRLVSSLHYLRTALGASAELTEGGIEGQLLANPDALFLADVGRLSDAEEAALVEWVESGGLLVRFAGPRMARGADLTGEAAVTEDPLLPVTLRGGGRAVGGAMAWGAPQAIREFAPESPFTGLTAPREVVVNTQILARLGPELAARTWAALEDGTPLVTAAELGAGRVVLFHVTANAEWSTLPISGLFVQMLERLISLSGASGGEPPLAEELMTQVSEIDGFGRIAAASGDLTAVTADRLLTATPGPDAPPGLYAGETARVAFNIFAGDAIPPSLVPAPPLSAITELLNQTRERPLAAWLLSSAVILLMIDLLVALWLSGRRLRFATMTGAALLAALVSTPPSPAAAQDIERALAAANDTVLAYVLTGDRQVDRLSEAGLRGLSNVLAARTAIEPGEPMSVDLSVNDISLFPLLYWPVTDTQAEPGPEAVAKINTYLRSGGMIVFDTRDAHLAPPGQPGPHTRALQRLARDLDLPPLAPVREDHVLTRTFYLLDRFPGRWTGGQVWLEATAQRRANDDTALIADPNDGVSPVIIGAADWAASWAIDENGDLLVPVGRANGARQREMSFRSGVNMVMYALTGNYKSDQVHVPALLERLGN